MESSPNREERQSTFELRTLLETSRLLIESRETDFILNNLLLIVMGKLLVMRGAVLLYEPSLKKYHLSKVKGKHLLDEGTYIELPDVLRFPKVSIIDESTLSDPPVKLFDSQKNGLFFNLRTSNHHLGYLYIGAKADQRSLSDSEKEFVESLCIISSVAIANSRMFGEMSKINRKLDQRVYELNTLFDLSKDFSLMTDREKITNTFKFSLLGQLLIRKFFLIYKLENEPVLMGSSGLDSDPGINDCREIFRHSDGLLLEDNELFEAMPYLQNNGISALVSLKLQGEKTAVVGVGPKANNIPFSRSDLTFLQSLGTLAVLSIQKSIFLEERIEKERLDEELAIAQGIQRGLLPDPVPVIPTLDLSAINVPSYQVGGDYYDVMATPDENFILAIGDVTGKGIPAALLMANLQSMLHVLLPVDISIDDATDRINDIIYKNTPADKFITFFWGKYYPQERRLCYVNAGHNPPYILKAGSDQMEELTEGGLILGAMPSPVHYDVGNIELNRGDLVIYFTDGVTEAFNDKSEEYGTERLERLICKHRDKSAASIQSEIVNSVRQWSGDSLSDDMTLIIFKLTE